MHAFMVAAEKARRIETLSDQGLRSKHALNGEPVSVIAGLVPATPIIVARRCHIHRGGRDKPGHDRLKNRPRANS